MAITNSFHNSIDAARAYQAYNGQQWVARSPFTTFWNRSLTYQFFTHFHPYVACLIQCLNDGGFPELQDSDTLYLPQPNPPTGQPVQPFQLIPNSTRATLASNATGTLPNNGPSVPITAGTPMTIFAGASVTVAAGITVENPDGTPLKLGGPLTFTLPGLLTIS